MELSSNYKRMSIYYKQMYITKMTTKSVHLSLWPAQNKMFVNRLSVTGMNRTESLVMQPLLVVSV